MTALVELLTAYPWPLYAAVGAFAAMLMGVIFLAWCDLTGRLT